MEARHLLKQLKDDGWYLGDTDGPCRQYVHPERPGVITVCVRFTDVLGPETQEQGVRPAERPTDQGEIRTETTRTGASAYSPLLSGVLATGADEEEARERMAGALRLHLQTLEKRVAS